MTWLAIRALLGRVPRRLWLALAAAALLGAGYLYHQHRVREVIAAAEKRGAATEAARIGKQALALKAKVDALSARIATEERTRHEEELRRIARDADDLRLSGPGKARAGCAVDSRAAGGRVEPVAAEDAPGPAMPSGDGAAVPWEWLVGRAEEHDAMRAEADAWREWYRRLVEAWPKDQSSR